MSNEFDEIIKRGVGAVAKIKKPSPEDDEEEKELKNKKLEQEIKDIKSDRQLREGYANKIIWFLYGYSVIVAIFIALSGFSVLNFSIATEVQVTLVGSTAVATIGLVGFVTKGLFK